MGLALPVEVSHNKVVLVPGMERSASTNRVMAVRYAWTPTSAACACAILSRSRLGESAALSTGLMLTSTRERASATALS